MAIRRELILARLRVIIGGIEGLSVGPGGEVRGAARNRNDISATARPAIVMHDGTEGRVGAGGEERTGRGPRRSAQQLMALHPQFVILLGKPAEEVGTASNVYLARLLTAVFTDAELTALLGPNGDMTYDGLAFELTPGENREARMVVDVTLYYPFHMADMAAA